MNRERRFLLAYLFAVLTALVALPDRAVAGPPLICHPILIGSAKSLPWTSDVGNLSGRSDYDLSRLVEDTLDLLSPSTPVLVRMETLRRATLYAQKDANVAKDLLARIQARATSAEAKHDPDALAWFDAGYLVECTKQANWAFKKSGSGAWEKLIKPNPASELDGYASILKAIKLRGEDAQMEFAAALITLDGSKMEHQQHAEKAMAGAKSDPLLAANLASHLFGNQGETVGSLFKRPKPGE
jgi:hypothetical protein